MAYFDAKKIKDGAVQWIKDYFEENGRGCCAVVGISGGKDSSLAAALCAEALGAGMVCGVLMPQGIQKDIVFSEELAASLGIRQYTVNIRDTVEPVLAAIGRTGLEINRQARINTPARIRMAVLYAVAAIVNGRVANTCNLSEDWVGYSTKYGDSAGDFSPLSHLTVTELRQIGYETCLERKFMDKIPEDGLSGLSDEENLGFSYAVLDRYIREGLCEDGAVREKIDRLHRLGLHKLALMPSYKPQI